MSIGNEIYFPFNASEDENGKLDREYDAEDFATYFSQFISNGVYPNPSTGLQVFSLYNNMVLSIKAGSGYIQGYGYVLKEDMNIQVNEANAAYNRKDTIVLQLNLTDRFVKCLYKPGIASANPIEPELMRNADIHELKLATILVRSGTAKIAQADITDTRLNTNVCGIVHALVNQVDTTTIFAQYENYLATKIVEWEATKVQQASNWQAQMTQQQTDFNSQTATNQQTFNEQHDTIQGWYTGIQQDITKLKGFDFDNLLELPGSTVVTTPSSGQVVELITNSSNGKNIADRTTVVVSSTVVRVTTRVYKEDGITVEKQVTVTTSINSNGTVTTTIV